MLKEQQGKEVLITISCDAPLTEDVLIEFKDQNNITIGALNVFANANHKDLHFEITPVRLLRSISKDADAKAIEDRIDHARGFGDPQKDLEGDLQNLETYLNTQALNQALLQCKIGKVYDVIIDEAEWIADDLIVEDSCVFKGDLLDKFNQEFEKQHPKAFKNRGITVYLSPLQHSHDGGEKGAGGYGNLGDIDAKSLVIFESNLFDKTSFVHEIAHVAGLEHSFKEEDDLNGKELIDYNKYVTEVDLRLNYLLKIKAPKNQIKTEWVEYKEDYTIARSKLNTYYRNLHKFEQGQTDNFMDYYNIRELFWKFQWKALQDDILKFYN